MKFDTVLGSNKEKKFDVLNFGKILALWAKLKNFWIILKLIFWECPRQPARIQIENRVYYQIIDFKIFLKFSNFVHSAKHFPKLSIYKRNSPCCDLAPCYISNQSLNQKNFYEFLKFFQEPGNKSCDESGVEKVRDGPMVFLAKMILISNTFTLHWERFFVTVRRSKKVTSYYYFFECLVVTKSRS